ncbi:MAG: methyl-accepting chemotaxis protein [Syntrophales bacterium]|jgi:methyl-accepting chemotaxis protein
MNKHQRQLKNFLIDKDIQLRIIVNVLLYLTFTIIVMLSFLFYPFALDMTLSNDLEVQFKAAYAFLILLQRVIPAVIVLFILFGTHMVFVTHRICGPLENFSQTLEKLAQGDLTRRVILRRDDYFKKKSTQINQMIDGFSSIVNKLIEDHQALIQTLDTAIGHIEDLNTEEKLRSSLEAIRQGAHNLENSLSQFKI